MAMQIFLSLSFQVLIKVFLWVERIVKLFLLGSILILRKHVYMQRISMIQTIESGLKKNMDLKYISHGVG